MSVSPNLLFVDQDYQINRSVRTRGSALGNFTRNLAGASTTTWTLSYWFKTGMYASTQTVPSMFDQVETAGLGRQIGIRADSGSLSISKYAPSTYTCRKVTAQVFRDPSAWYHVVVVWNTTVATAEDRVQFYVNGSRVTSWSINTIPAQNTAWVWTYFTNSMLGQQNRDGSAYGFFDGYLTEINFVDGQQLDASSFGFTDINGIWQPKPYSGTYGTNGFYLKFTDNSAATAAAIGKDYSGNGNNWTPNNISVTADVTYDSMLDSPTNSATASNYAVVNPLVSTAVTISNGNLTLTNGAANRATYGSIGVSTGKWYWECVLSSGAGGDFGISTDAGINSATYVGGTAGSWAYDNTGSKYNNSAGTAYGASWTVGDIVGVAFDATAGSLTFYKNNVSQGVAFSSLAAGTYYPATSIYNGTGSVNFGQRPFTYTPPSGYVAINTYNLAASIVPNGAVYMAASTYTGTGATQSIANSGNNAAARSFQPDLVWIKGRNVTSNNVLIDSVRGTVLLVSDLTDAEISATPYFSSINSNGFTVTGTSAATNQSAETLIGWQWQAGQGTNVLNGEGSIFSTVSVNRTAGFSVVTYTGTGANTTVGHGLGVTPKMVIVKGRNSITHWSVYHSSLGAGNIIFLELTNASTALATAWNNTAPTSTTVSLGTYSDTNGSGTTFVAYSWSEVAGYSKFGSYTGNGSTDGTFVYCGFRPRWVLAKRTDSISNWYLHDTSRDPYNVASLTLEPNLTNAEAASTSLDILSNGFKWRGTLDPNVAAGTYIFAAFAENPFNTSRAR